MKPDLAISRKFARFVANNLPDDSNLLLGMSSVTLEAMAPARTRGMKVIIERGSAHIVHQTRILEEACRNCGLVFNDTDPRMIEREVREYADAAAISVLSRHANRTFVAEGIPKEKLLVNSPGVDLSRFRVPSDRPDNPVPRIIFVGGVGVRKGVPWLLRAFRKRLVGKAELHVFGQIEASSGGLLPKLVTDGVVIHGPVSSERLAGEYARADIFCLPSVEEGFDMVVAQAMASGLPVVLSEAVGATDLLTPGEQGLIVPAMNEDALADALLSLVEDGPLRHKMATAAVKRAQECTWDSYVSGVIAGYKKILA